MDPNACLNEMRRIAASFDSAKDDEERAGLGSELVDLVNGMDTWLGQGGYLGYPSAD